MHCPGFMCVISVLVVIRTMSGYDIIQGLWLQSEYNTGPRTEPWGTPKTRGIGVDVRHSTVTDCILSLRGKQALQMQGVAGPDSGCDSLSFTSGTHLAMSTRSLGMKMLTYWSLQWCSCRLLFKLSAVSVILNSSKGDNSFNARTMCLLCNCRVAYTARLN